MVLRYITLDGYKYAVESGSYVRSWARQFTATLAANIVELNFVDKGPGIKTYDFTLILNTWLPDSEPYKDGITQTIAEQIANLEASYEKVATALNFLDPFGNPPNPDPSLQGVYFTLLRENIPAYSTVQKPYILMDVEVVEGLTAIS